jgi:hypothetical protein
MSDVLLIRASGGNNLVIRPQGRDAFYPSTSLKPAVIEVYWHWEDEPPSGARLIGRYLPGQTVQWPYNPVGDKNVVLRAVSISAAGVRSPRELRDAPAFVVSFQRVVDAPIVSQVGAATHTSLTLAIDGVSDFAIKRRIRTADDSGITTNVSVQISPASFIDAAFIGALARDPGAGELIIWRNAFIAAAAVSSGALLTEARARIKGLFQSAEYTARSRSNGEFVNDLYHAYLDRPPDGGSWQAWVDVITGGASRSTMDDNFGNSSEFSNRVAARDPWLDVPAGQPLPRLVVIERNDSDAGTKTIYVRVSHTSGGDWSAESAAQSFTFADSGGSGGGTGDTDPFPLDKHGLPVS